MPDSKFRILKFVTFALRYLHRIALKSDPSAVFLSFCKQKYCAGAPNWLDIWMAWCSQNGLLS